MTGKAASTKKNAGASKGKGAPAAKAVGKASRASQVPPDIAALEAKVAHLPKMIRPKYVQFDSPNEPVVIIQKISVGKRDEIVEDSSPNGEFDSTMMVKNAVAASLVYPEITLEQVNDIDPEDFSVIWDEVNALSYRKVGEVVNAFHAAKGN